MPAPGTIPALFGAILRESPQAEAIVDGDLRLTFADWPAGGDEQTARNDIIRRN